MCRRVLAEISSFYLTIESLLCFRFQIGRFPLQHEEASLAMFDYLVTENDLKPVMEQYGLVLPEDLDFIKEQIAGPLDTNAAQGRKVPSSACVKAVL